MSQLADFVTPGLTNKLQHLVHLWVSSPLVSGHWFHGVKHSVVRPLDAVSHKKIDVGNLLSCGGNFGRGTSDVHK